MISCLKKETDCFIENILLTVLKRCVGTLKVTFPDMISRVSLSFLLYVYCQLNLTLLNPKLMAFEGKAI